MTHPAETWVKRFLDSRDSSMPSGSPLYTYRMTRQEFDEFEQLLRRRLGDYLAKYSLGQVASGASFFPPAFVLYAAEWWRRRYDGTGWSWEPILSSLGAPAEGWSQSERSACVTEGLRYWRLGVRETRGLRYLGSIAFQGGLPLQLLSSARGSLAAVLRRVLRLAAAANPEPANIQAWVESLQQYLPQAYRQPQIFLLLTEVILAVLRLKESAQLDSADGAVEKLNQHDPSWRNRFPLPIEDDQAQGLLNQLVQDAAAARVSRATSPISVSRTLEEVSDGEWRLRADIELPEYLEAATLTDLFSIEQTALSRIMTLTVRRGDNLAELGLRQLAGQEKYRVQRQPLLVSGKTAVAEHLISLRSASGSEWHAELPDAAALDDDLIWLFDVSRPRGAGFPLLRQGGGAVADGAVLLILPRDWTIEAEAGSRASLIGELAELGGTVHRVEGAALCRDENGTINRVRCGQASAGNEQLAWRGDRVWDGFVSPPIAFRGVPKLIVTQESGLTAPATGTVAWRAAGAGFCPDPRPGLVGPVQAVWPSVREPQWRSRLVLLPKDAAVEFTPGRSPLEGEIRFRGWSLLGCRVLTEGAIGDFERFDTSAVVSVSWKGAAQPPEWLDIELTWSGNVSSARYRAPFPAVGARAFDASGNALVADANLTLGQLHGVRLVAFLGDQHYAILDLQLDAAGEKRAGLDFALKPGSHSSRIELRLLDYEPDIQRLLSSVDGIDARVQVVLRVGSATPVRLSVARYACSVEHDRESGAVVLSRSDLPAFSVEQLGAIRVAAIRLDAPAEEPNQLPTRVSEGVPVGAWEFSPDGRPQGTWFIYPPRESAVAFRPTVWSTIDVENPGPGLIDAMRIRESAPRIAALDEVIRRLASNFLDDDWQHVDQLVASIGHLPLPAVDLWRRFGHSAPGMAALAFRLGGLPTEFIARFGVELPFMWELAAYEDWRNAVAAAKGQVAAWFGESDGEVVLKGHLDSRVQLLSELSPGVRVLLELARADVTGEVAAELRPLRNPVMDQVFRAQLFEGPDSELQKLLRRSGESEWPVQMAADVAKARNDPNLSEFLCPTSYDFHDSVINTPLIAAAATATDGLARSWLDDAAKMRALRAHRVMDPDWFDAAYQWTVARLLAKGRLQISVPREHTWVLKRNNAS